MYYWYGSCYEYLTVYGSPEKLMESKNKIELGPQRNNSETTKAVYGCLRALCVVWTLEHALLKKVLERTLGEG